MLLKELSCDHIIKNGQDRWGFLNRGDAFGAPLRHRELSPDTTTKQVFFSRSYFATCLLLPWTVNC